MVAECWLCSATCQLCDRAGTCVQRVSIDTRPEVRNSGVRTLYSVVASHGARLSRSAWDEALWDILFPLLRTVHQMAATSSREEVIRCPHACYWQQSLISKLMAPFLCQCCSSGHHQSHMQGWTSGSPKHSSGDA